LSTFLSTRELIFVFPIHRESPPKCCKARQNADCKTKEKLAFPSTLGRRKMELEDELEAIESFLQGEDAEIHADKSGLAEQKEATVQILLAIGGVCQCFTLHVGSI